MSAHLLDTLNPQQQAVVRAKNGPVLVLAGAGSGKTRALTHRMAYLVASGAATPTEIMAVTFTNKAAREMKERVTTLVGTTQAVPSAIGTFHSLCARILREHASATSRSARFTILDTADSEQVLKLALKATNTDPKQWSPQLLRHTISRAKNALQTPEDIASHATSLLEEVVGRVYTEYQTLLAQNDAYDFDDLIMATITLFTKAPTIRAAYQATWRFLSVDEYQDTNPAQEQLLQLLLGPEKNLCVVGDDYQAIYSWRGARVDHILRFESTYPNCTVLYLTQNYRSTPAILAAANQVIAANEHQKHKELWTKDTATTRVQLVTLPSDRHEARWVRQAIQQHIREGRRASDIAVLYRTNAQSRLFEEQCLMHEIPYTIVGGFRFYDRREVKDAIALLQLYVNPRTSLAINRLARAFLPGIGPVTIQRLVAHARAQHQSLWATIMAGDGLTDRQQATLRPLAQAYLTAPQQTFTTVADTLRYLLDQTGYARALKREADGAERWENIEELQTVALGYSDVTAFMEAVALLSDIDTTPETGDYVTFMTLHAAKGLEFPRVFLVGCEEGLLPHRNSIEHPEQVAEERRLLYVGITRAQQQLTLTHTRMRLLHGELTPQRPSSFLKTLPPEVERWEEESFEPPIAESVVAPIIEQVGEPVLVTAEVGELIAHPQFGQGVVVMTSGSLLTCVFEGHGVKTVDGTKVMSQG